MDLYSLECGRLVSFKTNWPHPSDSLCSRETMAKAGFFHMGTGDLVRCFVCRIKLDGWDPDQDNPWKKHIEYSPYCLFAKLAKEEGQLTIEEWLDIICNQAVNKIESTIGQLEKLNSST